jgi:hypothetical protein
MWAFSSNFDMVRRRKLEAYDAFEKVFELVCREAQVVRADVCEGKELGPQDCWRPMVVLDVGKDVFDAFFNSPGGYRAQYLSDPDRGQAANNRLLRALEPKLTNAVVERCGEQHLGRGRISSAFLANSAKVWPDEAELNVAKASVDLEIARWKQPCAWINFPRNARLWAPEGTKLTAFGAFLDHWGNEVVSRKKIRRRFDIYQCGFS